MDAFSWAALAALVVSAVNYVTYVKAKAWDPVVKQTAAYVGGVVATIVAAHSDFGATLPVAERALDTLNGASQVLVGLALGGVAIFGNEVKKAIDSTDSAVKPPLVGGPKV
jgi:hypothetical protein